MEKQKTIGNYIILSKLGTGSYGVVYKVKSINKNNIYVIKQIPFDHLSSKQIYEVKQEAKILSSINSIYVVKYYNSFEENNCLNIVMEYCDGGDLSAFLQKNKKTKILLKEDLVWTLFLKITIGLAAIHNLKILHRDLKALNIFLTKDLDVKIGDLGVAKMLTHTKFAKTFIGTPYYLSPEICQDMPYNDKSDVWALGCILYELCTYKHPFEAKSQGALILKILKNQPAPIHNYYSNDLQELIYRILEKDEELRPSCYDILMTPNILEKLKNYRLIDKVNHLYPYFNNINYNYYQNNDSQYIYDNYNKIYDYYSNGYDNNIIYDSNAGFNNNYYYESAYSNNNYYLNNNGQIINSLYNNKSNSNNNINQKGIYNSNSERYIKYNKVVNNQNKILNNQNKIDNNKKICSICLENNKNINKINNIKIIENKNEIKRININPILRKHKSDIDENNLNKIIILNGDEQEKKVNNHKITYINAIKYTNNPNQDNNTKELFRNRSNDNLTKPQKLNIEFNNIKETNKNNKNNIIELKTKEKNNEILNNNNENKITINNTQLNNKLKVIKSEKKNESKLLDTITEFANNLNKYVDQHNSAQKNIKDIPSPFTLQSIITENEELKSEECPKDNIRNKNKKNSENKIITEGTNYSQVIENAENDEFKIIDNNEKDTKNESINKLTISSVNSKDNEHTISLTNHMSNINSAKINSIIENHKNLKILRNDEKNDEGDIKEDSKEKEKDKQFEENLYSSEEEKNGNIYDSEEESDSRSEIVKEIKERKNRDSSMTKSMALLSNEEIKNKLKNEIDNLKEKIENIKNDMLKLIGEEDYKYINDLYSKVENNTGEIDEIYKKIEEYIKNKYEDDKRGKLDDLYFYLITYDCQLAKKEQQLKKYL